MGGWRIGLRRFSRRDAGHADPGAASAGTAFVDADGIERRVGCAFEQQLSNIQSFGRAENSKVVLDADGMFVATVTHSCDTWIVGADADGLIVIINRPSGQVGSHGLYHVGAPASRLPSLLRTPLATK